MTASALNLKLSAVRSSAVLAAKISITARFSKAQKKTQHIVCIDDAHNPSHLVSQYLKIQMTEQP